MVEEAKRGRGRPRTIDRDEVVRTALMSWWKEGAGTLSVNEISRRTGLSKSSLYREFGGEDGLMKAALEVYRTLSVEPLIGLFAEARPAKETLDRVIAGTTADRGLPAGCFFTNLRLDLGHVGDDTRALVEDIAEQRRAAFAAWFASAVQAGQASAAFTPEAAARYLDAQITLVLVRMAAKEPVQPIREDARIALQVLLAG